VTDSRILLGVIGRAHGVSGRVRVTSHTADPASLTAYGPLSDANGRQFLLRWRSEGVAEVAEIVDGTPVKIGNRSAAERLTNVQLFIDRSRLPPPDEDEFYLADLIGLTAVDVAGEPIGTVTVVHDYGAGTSLEIAKGETTGASALIVPFTQACVPVIDLAGRRVTVVPPEEVAVIAEDAAA
jgi:16S rRNA processing protein RimM